MVSIEHKPLRLKAPPPSGDGFALVRRGAEHAIIPATLLDGKWIVEIPMKWRLVCVDTYLATVEAIEARQFPLKGGDGK